MAINNPSDLLAAMRRVLDNDKGEYERFVRVQSTGDRDAAQARATVAAMSGGGDDEQGKKGGGRSAGGRDAAAAKKTVNAMKGAGGSSPSGVLNSSVGRALDQAMGRLERMASGVTEVVVKVSNKQAGKGAVGRHLSYISRHGKLELENQEQMGYRGTGEVKSIPEEWKIQEKLATDPDKDTLNVIFSMADGVDPELMRDAVRDALAEIFKGHKYVFVLHDKEHDAKTKEHPHCHVVVQKDCYAPQRGRPKRLRHGPRELAAWRQAFASQLRERGIAAEATRRYARGKFQKPERQTTRQIKDRGGEPLAGAPSVAVIERLKPSKAKSKASAFEKYTQVQRDMLELADGIERFMPAAADLAKKLRMMVQRSTDGAVQQAAPKLAKPIEKTIKMQQQAKARKR
jgi:hypothetical protein